MARIVKAARPSALNASSRIRLSGNAPAPRNRLPVVRVLRWMGIVAVAIIAASHVYRFLA